MLTTDYINNEIEFAKQIFIYYTEKLADYLTVGSNKYNKWYNDSLQIWFLIGALEEVVIDGEDIYIGKNTVEEDLVVTIFRKIREYYTYEIDTNYTFNEVVVSPVPTYTEPFTADWKEFDVAVTTDSQTEVILPVNIDNIADTESVIVWVNNNNTVIPNTNITENGYHITGTTLYWHNYYDLVIGDIIHAKYKQIKG